MPEKVKTRPANRNPVWVEADALTNAMLNGKELSYEQERHLSKLIEIWEIMKNNPKAITNKKVQMTLKVNRPNAYRWIRNAESFFGELYDINVKTERIKQQHRLEGIIHNKKVDPETRLRAEKLMAEILGTSQKAGVGQKPKKRQIIRRTTDPKALREEVINESYE